MGFLDSVEYFIAMHGPYLPAVHHQGVGAQLGLEPGRDHPALVGADHEVAGDGLLVGQAAHPVPLDTRLVCPLRYHQELPEALAKVPDVPPLDQAVLGPSQELVTRLPDPAETKDRIAMALLECCDTGGAMRRRPGVIEAD